MKFLKVYDIIPFAVKRDGIKYRGVEQLVARRAHNPEVAGSSPVPATSVAPDPIRFGFGRFFTLLLDRKGHLFCCLLTHCVDKADINTKAPGTWAVSGFVHV